ncbi:hypothetical protein FQN49_000011 [Arthroderma sp. PD_2]|nr:hypothetical protein FQN49_000011 [Arthroderma sp. PD_2]
MNALRVLAGTEKDIPRPAIRCERREIIFAFAIDDDMYQFDLDDGEDLEGAGDKVDLDLAKSKVTTKQEASC